MAKTPNLDTPTVPIDLIDRPANIRREPGDTAELEGSIANIGLIEPLVVRSDGNGRFVLLAGFRRIAALERLGITEAPVHVITHPEDDLETSRIVLQLVENLQRVDISPIEEASGYAQLKQYGWKQREIAKRVSRSEAHVSKRLSLLDLPDTALEFAESGRLGSEALYELSRVASAGGDVEQIVTDLATNHEDDDDPIDTEEVGAMAKEALRGAKAQQELSARKTEYESQGIKVQIAGTNPDGQPKLPKDRLGYGYSNDLDLDHDEHLKEPCALMCLWTRWDNVYESQHCTDRRRHAPDGASDLKLVKPAKAQTPEAKAKAESRRRGQALTAAAEAALAGRQPARDKILERVAVLYLERLEAAAHNRAAKYLDVEVELQGEYKGVSRLYEDADSANQVRILFAAVLAHGHQSSTGTYGAPDEGHLEFLADIGHPIDLTKVEKGAQVDVAVDDAIAEGKRRGL